MTFDFFYKLSEKQGVSPKHRGNAHINLRFCGQNVTLTFRQTTLYSSAAGAVAAGTAATD